MSQPENIHPPILIAEGLDLSVFASVEDAERQVESPDVDEYEVFDSAGRRLLFLGKTKPRGRFIKTVDVGPVHLIPEETEPTHQEQLRQLIMRCLRAIGESEDKYHSATLEQLVDEARLKFGVT